MDFSEIARGTRPECIDTVTASVGKPTGGIATKARSSENKALRMIGLSR